MKKNKITRFFGLSMFMPVFLALVSCSDWTDMETVDSEIKRPWEQDPALWAKYTAALREYKLSEHFISYARLYNSPVEATSEKDFMRSLPDSLDIVSLTNADNFSKFDAEDLSVMREKGTRVLYQVDYATRFEELGGAQALGAYLDRVVAAVAAKGLDGYSFTGIPNADDPATAEAAALIVSKLSADADRLLVFEGNPLFVATADREKIDFFVLDTEKTTNVSDLKLQVQNALGYAAVPAAKLLLAAESGAPLNNEENAEQAAIEEMARRVVSLGPLCGLGTYNIGNDYYHSNMNYSTIRQAIQTLNPSK
ncbi:glycoside hydrolase family 18 [uncultured Alistipes sp.]|jgi:hypothetical protein|uniref:glycoside hydrolase family 18 n=1 Tax=uncultured Alistipes sp. TaxID=538949 RepID=UPI0025E61C88|nr:glycoside hydrolase family 18 [uncultured Alistipes sp.]